MDCQILTLRIRILAAVHRRYRKDLQNLCNYVPYRQAQNRESKATQCGMQGVATCKFSQLNSSSARGLPIYQPETDAMW
jgi:hypothetical protein